ncbi:cytochrome c1 [Legionella saoudiensis]|uniref:cytochrome c1 n=1 Tax=Legionella saoudiensis TaxID=1750561 RepID=UPI0007318E4B|nr:cytochrome c1 [Legionella saoudiensis]
MRKQRALLAGGVLGCLLLPILGAQSWAMDNKPSLQRGAKLYMNYCSGCHSLKYLRYNHMAEGLGLIGFDGRIDEDLLKNNLIFTDATVNDPIRIALPPEDAKQWFGVVPPDLSLVTREKGANWLFSYLKSFYTDNSRPFGVNNLMVPGVAMPNILEPLIGEMTLVPGTKEQAPHLSLVKEGELSAAQLDSLLQDLVSFLIYVGEPTQAIRHRLGGIVLAFLLVFLLVVFALKRVYWQKTS